MSQQVSGPLGAAFGREPVVFVKNIVAKEIASFRRLTQRLSERTGIKEWTTSGAHPFHSRMVASTHDDALHVATIVVLWCIKRPDLVVDEGGRMAFNLPVGPHVKALEGDDVNVANNGDGWPKLWGSAEKGEDPITLGAILTIGLPIIVAIAPVVLPILISLIGGAVAAVTGGPNPFQKAPPPPPPPPTIFGIPENIALAVGAAGLGFALFYKG